jgi:pimeloyl-ACP methyl ester carboxylesterase
MATFVLLPAAWCGGWCWHRVAPLLRAAGHAVYAPTPTGLGERVHLAHPGIDLETHVTDVLNVLFYEDLTDVTLVGWSYGGMVAAGVADRAPERLAQLAYLDAAIPEDGQSLFEAAEDDGSLRAAYQERIAAAGTPGFLPFRTEGLEARVPDDADRAWMVARIVPHPIATFAQPIRLRNPAAARLPRAYVLCTEGRDPDGPEPAFLRRARSDPGWRFREVAANHLAPISAPRATADALLALV